MVINVAVFWAAVMSGFWFTTDCALRHRDTYTIWGDVVYGPVTVFMRGLSGISPGPVTRTGKKYVLHYYT
jgi:hypothetical protein